MVMQPHPHLCLVQGVARPESGMTVWTCVTIYLARPCIGHNVYAGAYMCTPRGNDYALAVNFLDWIWIFLFFYLFEIPPFIFSDASPKHSFQNIKPWKSSCLVTATVAIEVRWTRKDRGICQLCRSPDSPPRSCRSGSWSSSSWPWSGTPGPSWCRWSLWSCTPPHSPRGSQSWLRRDY